MSLFGSKTKYYVASSCSPLFNDEKRVSQYKAAMLDYTSNSPIEMSEYMKNYFNTSRLRTFRGYLEWCRKNGFNKYFGEISASFLGDAVIDTVKVTQILQPTYDPNNKKEFQVFNATLALFSEDFYIKHLATQQGKAHWFHQWGDLYYTITYPKDGWIRATLNNGNYIEGPLPERSKFNRFLEISYSILKKIEETIPPDPNDPNAPTIVKKFKTIYGYLQYQEGSGNAELDKIIRDNGITGSKTFFPVIPLRTNTSWYEGTAAEKINEALEYLSIVGTDSKKTKPYTTLQDACVKGMEKGSIGDIDYITLLLGVSIKSIKPSDTAYIYNFFYNIHVNYHLSIGYDPAKVKTPKSLMEGKGRMSQFMGSFFNRLRAANYTDGVYHSFWITCPSSNLQLEYKWGDSDYFEVNGKFKPDAQVGEYGVLAGRYTAHWKTLEVVADDEGHIQGHYEGEDFVPDKHWVNHYAPYTMAFFCHQVSLNRWNFVSFVDPLVRNHIYHGKFIDSWVIDSIEKAGATQKITHEFTHDFGIAGSDEYKRWPMTYITSSGELDSEFIIPLEQNTFYEVGVINDLEISYGSQFLIFNCWVKKKVKWYQRGFFSVFLSFAGIAIGMAVLPIAPIIGTVGITYFATTLVVTLTATMMDLTLKILTKLFGNRLGTQIYNFVRSLVGVVCGILQKYFGYIGLLISTAIMFAVTSADVIRAGGSMKDAIKKGLAAGAITYYAGKLGGAAGQFIGGGIVSVAVSAGITSFGTSLINGGSVKDAFKAGLKGAIFGAAMYGVSAAFDKFLINTGLTNPGNSEEELALQHTTQEAVMENSGSEITSSFDWDTFSSLFVNEVFKNPMTYERLINMTLEEISYHKLANLENDYQEFSDAYKAAMNTYYEVSANQVDVITTQYVCKLQNCMGRLLTMFPDVNQSMTPDNVLLLGISTGSEVIKTALGSVPTYVENKLTMNGLSPESLHYSKTDYTLTWDI